VRRPLTGLDGEGDADTWKRNESVDEGVDGFFFTDSAPMHLIRIHFTYPDHVFA
jgi:hypothetical protein